MIKIVDAITQAEFYGPYYAARSLRENIIAITNNTKPEAAQSILNELSQIRETYLKQQKSGQLQDADKHLPDLIQSLHAEFKKIARYGARVILALAVCGAVFGTMYKKPQDWA